MTGGLLRVIAGTALLAAGGTAAAQPPQVQVEHAAARVVVIAEPRGGVSVSVAHGPSRLPPLSVRQDGGRVIVDGGLARPFGDEHIDCGGGPRLQDRTVEVNGSGRIAYAELPVITIHAPLDVRLATEGAVFGQVSAARSVQLEERGCADWALGPVQQRLSLASAGSADVHGSDVGSLQAHSAGSGDVDLRRVNGGMDLVIGGSSDVRAALVQGPLQAKLSGSGALTIDRIEGPVSVEQSGSGDVRLNGGSAPVIQVGVSGSANFDFGGHAGRVQASTSGSGDIRIAHASGPVSQASSGSGEIEIGR